MFRAATIILFGSKRLLEVREARRSRDLGMHVRKHAPFRGRSTGTADVREAAVFGHRSRGRSHGRTRFTNTSGWIWSAGRVRCRQRQAIPATAACADPLVRELAAALEHLMATERRPA
jgi:hypothetical protein